LRRQINSQTGKCRGFCTLQWLTLRGEYSGSLYNISSALVRVPYGVAEEPDKRRAGVWYVGVQALPDQAVRNRRGDRLTLGCHQSLDHFTP